MPTPSPDLVADCGSCFGLCCVALPFTRSADFAFSKAGGEPCHNLTQDFGCGVHSSLRDLGMPGCTVYDCFGAGQAVSRGMYDGHSWRGPVDGPAGDGSGDQAAGAGPGSAGSAGADRERASEMFEVFGSVRRLHEMLFHLTAAIDQLAAARPEARPAARPAARPEARATIDARRDTHAGALHARLTTLRDQTAALARGTPYDVLGVDVDAHRMEVAPVLREASAVIREATPAGVDLAHVRRSDLAGHDLATLDLRSADLRGALLIGADLSHADLRWADLLGADLRACDVRGADLTHALFLTQMQVNAAHGDADTGISEALARPSHWR
ncbi:pentapeptide repeat-containing protein [Nocardioides sp. JQ2195]|uniref:pentapeptide repeat-containing protein n=1 Tax=Nocardioides sp. JQ2195 TaxID=2592334 RepID=UPI00143EC85E|nr:pentapeptide repeat-containing protein [Nocardioides sp. JQ2195]QIX27270.1 pentapeptide repeat-containing protein [Nocardioides sp. JQ2195]